MVEINIVLFVPFVLTIVGLFAIIILLSKRLHQENEYVGEFNDDDDDDVVEMTLHVAYMNGRAYWIYDNVLYEAEETRQPDFETAHPFDTFSLSDEEVGVYFSILDGLAELEKDTGD